VKSQCSERPPQRELTPAAAHLGPAQRGHQIARLALQQRLAPGERLDLRAQTREGIAALAFERLHLCLGAFQGRAQRLDQLRDRHLTLLERALRHHLIAPERLARQAQKQLAVGSQGLAGEAVEGGAQPRLGLLEEREALDVLEGLGLQAHLGGRQLDPQRLDAPAGADMTQQRPEYGAGDEGGADDDIDEVRDGDHRRKCAR
jgi:hypothetical protein